MYSFNYQQSYVLNRVYLMYKGSIENIFPNHNVHFILALITKCALSLQAIDTICFQGLY